MKEILEFLRQLSKNNNREWFNSHKEEYLKVKGRIDEIASKLILRVALFDSDAATLTPADCTYRIYRDTRFSSDKTPYKTHIGIFINPPFGKKSNRMGYYVHIEPGNCFVAVGTVCLPSKTIGEIRKAIYENVEEYLSIIEEPSFSKIFAKIGENCLKTAPKGIPKDWKYVELVRPKDFVASHGLSDREMCSPDLVENIGRMFEIAKPFNDFVNFTIDGMEN